MPTLAPNKRTTWERNLYSSVAVTWAGTAGAGTVSVKQDTGAAVSHAPPHTFPLDLAQGGSLTNNTSQSVNYALS